jgi:cell division septum initiation protein DivIVA
MKRRIFLSLAVLLAISAASYAATARSGIDASLDAIEAKYDQLLEMEAQRKREFIAEKDQLEKEVEDLKGRLVGREEREEKLKKESEVRWYRNEYKKVLNQYDDYYKNINKMIVQKEARIDEISMILSVME